MCHFRDIVSVSRLIGESRVILATVCWEKYSSKCSIEGRMVKVGRDSDGSTLVVARAWKDNELIPCKARPTQGIAFCASGNREYNVYRYEVIYLFNDWSYELIT
uniref:FER1L6 protein n=1 Tax=Fopius arisanus TaxID=64838 RepID=A0A0C9RMC9_9HYME